MNQVLATHLDQLERVTATTTACRLLGLSRATVNRWRGPRVYGPARPPGGGLQPAALTAAEKDRVLRN